MDILGAVLCPQQETQPSEIHMNLPINHWETLYTQPGCTLVHSIALRCSVFKNWEESALAPNKTSPEMVHLIYMYP